MQKPPVFIVLALLLAGLVLKPVAYSAEPETVTSSILDHQPKPIAAGIHPQAWIKAIEKYNAFSSNKLKLKPIIAIADLSQPSTAKRLYIIHTETREVLLQTYVAHGKNSGENLARFFSNSINSFRTSLGFYTCGRTYTGKHGESLVLYGQEAGLNDNAVTRSIVMHAAEYVSEEFIKLHHRLGRSQGCPAVPKEDLAKIIGYLEDGGALYIFSPSTVAIK